MTSGDEKTRILIVDDHTMFRESLARLLEAEQDFQVQHCGSGDDGVSILCSWRVDLVLLDFYLGSEKGSTFLAKARAAGFEGKTLLLTAGVNDLEAANLIRQGISGILLKGGSLSELLRSIREVLSGKVWFDQAYLKRIMQKVTGSEVPGARGRFLTERQRQVLSMVLEGLANRKIAERLHVSEGSVKNSLQQLFEKTGVHTRSQLVRVALEQFKDEL